MAVNVSVYNIDDYPDNVKTVTTDLKTVVPLGKEGDEKWVLSFTTNAYSDNANATAIQDVYIQEVKTGWFKSSGFVGTGGKFTIDSDNNALGVKIDASVGPTAGPGYYTITLSSGVNVTGEAIAADIQTNIIGLPDDSNWNDSDDGYSTAYLSSIVRYTGGKFWVVSGSVSAYYTGASRSSVKMYKIAGDMCFETLGFNLSVDSESVAGTAITEVLLASNYNGGTATMTVDTGLGAVAGDGLVITDDDSTHYFTALSGTVGTTVKLAVVSTNGFDAIPDTVTYSGSVSKVQKLTVQDPDNVPKSYYTDVDEITRWGIRNHINQIDFSS